MQDLIQLVLSIFFGLLPLWIFLGRMRARARGRNSAGTATAPKDESSESAEDAPPPSSVWPYQQWYQVTTSPEDHRVLVETNAQSTQEYTNTEAPPADASVTNESTTTQDAADNTLDDTPTTLDHTLDDTLDTTLEHGLESTVFTPDKDLSSKELRPKDDSPAKKGGEQSNIPPNILMPNIVSLSSSELRRAIIVSEILAPPLSLRDAHR